MKPRRYGGVLSDKITEIYNCYHPEIEGDCEDVYVKGEIPNWCPLPEVVKESD